MSVAGLIAAGVGSVLAFMAADAYIACLSSIPGPFTLNLSAALEGLPTYVMTHGLISFEKGPLLAGFVGFIAVWVAWSQAILSAGNHRYGEEHGSAEWGSLRYARKFGDKKHADNNIILTKSISLAVDQSGKRDAFQRPRNVMVIGGTGSGKSFRYVIPNILQMNADFVALDPKGTLMPKVAPALIENDYDIACLNLVDMTASDDFNPVINLRNEVDILEFVECYIANTTGDKAHAGDPFWEKAERLLFVALLGYLVYHCPPEDRTLSGVVSLLALAEAKENDPSYLSPLDMLFREIETGMRLVENDEFEGRTGLRGFGADGGGRYKWVRVHDPVDLDSDFTLMHYKMFKDAADKTLKSILISCNTRMEPVVIPQVRKLLSRDDMHIDKLGDASCKRAIFVVMSDTSSTFSFLTALFMWQTVHMLCRKADVDCKGELKRPVHLILDEFANAGKLPDIEHAITTIRSRNIFMTIILQSFAQLESRYEKDAQTIVDNCDTLLFLGGKSNDTNEMISKMIGKETVDTISTNVSRGANGSTSRNMARVERDLMQAAEVGRLDRGKAIVLFSNAKPLVDEKYPTDKHQRWDLVPGHEVSQVSEGFDFKKYQEERIRHMS
ncbi:MAG: type IV secretory system conjugative DNA transfer family protein [Gordonibacter sp.]|uniref:VirD4-like conjugal transfer protein, CD1115 family n=1 Tax=Gordonibacter sp. TaxID=1968902 RepID=UPI002FC92BCA